MSATSIYWYDFETFGIDPRRARASQFAGLRTDLDLNPIGEPLVQYCQPAKDFLPSPMSCLITGITPQQASREGLIEAEFIRRIHGEFSQPGSCVAGYNSIRFDDELTRQLLYRNFYDPYEREWKHGNSRWDIIDMLRLCAAVRPEGINWPRRDDGSISFRLEELTAANDVDHGHAHDALSDVEATIAVARLVKERQPRLYDYVFQLRDKRRVRDEIDLQTRSPVLHVSGMYPARQGCLALVVPVCAHPDNGNGIIVYDLRQDPGEWMSLSVAEIRQRLFTPAEQLPEGVNRIALKTLHTNKCPVVASPSVLPETAAADFEIDMEACRRHWLAITTADALPGKLAQVFHEDRQTGADADSDPDFMIYSGGFFSDDDKELMRTLRGSPPVDLGRLDFPFRDLRLPEMLFRYRARNYPDTLGEDELQRWQNFCQSRLQEGGAEEHYREEMTQARAAASPDQQSLLDEVDVWLAQLKESSV